MVNEEARRQRHAKLKQQNVQLITHASNPVSTTAVALKESIQHLCKSPDNPVIGRLFKKILVYILIFFLVVPFMSTYQITHGSYVAQAAYEGMYNEEFDENEDENTIADVMTEDGFLLKPAINSTEGDRSGFSDVFVYTVEPGDTLSSIAESFNLKKETIMAENNLWNPNSLKVGSKLNILPVDGLSHKVAKNETLESIAKKYKVEKDAIVKQNQLEDETLIADLVLIIPGAKREAPVYSSSSAPARSHPAA